MLRALALVKSYFVKLTTLLIRRANHLLGSDVLVKLVGGESLELESGLLEGDSLLVGVLGNLGGHVVANLGVEGGHQHERLVHELGDSLLVGDDAVDAVDSERSRSVGNESDGLEQVGDHDGLEDVELELAGGTGVGDGGVVAENLAADHGQSLVLGGVDLTGHDGRTGLVLGESKLAVATSGSGTEVSDIVGDLEERNGNGVEGTGGLDNGVVGSKSLKLVGGGGELLAGDLGDLGGNSRVETLLGVETGADGGSSLGKVSESGENVLDSLNAVLHLGGVAGELLSESERSGVLQMGSANLDDVVKLLGLGVQRLLEQLELGDQRLGDLHDSGNVHDGGEGVVGRLRHVDVIIGVDGGLGAQLAAEHLNGSVGDDLVGVHVGLGTGSGLENNQGEVLGQLTVNDLLGGLLDGLSDLGVQTVLHVDGGSGLLEDTKGSDKRLGHLGLLSADVKVLQRSLGLGSPVDGVVDVNVSKGVLLHSLAEKGGGGGEGSGSERSRDLCESDCSEHLN